MRRLKMSATLLSLGLIISVSCSAPPSAEPKPAPEKRAPATLTLAFLPQRDVTALLPDAQAVAARIGERMGVPVKAYVADNYAAVVEALRADHAQAAFMSGWPAALAARLADARIVLGEVREGKTSYWSQFYARRDSGIASLAEAKGKRVAFTSPTSSSGYLFPMAKLVEEGLLERAAPDPKAFFSEVLFAGGYEQALRALVRGQVDVAAASEYAFGLYLSPEEQANVVVIARQGPVPTHGVAVKNSLPDDFVKKFEDAILAMAADETDKAVLKKLYGAETFARVSHDEHLSAVFRAEELTGMRYATNKP